MRTLPFEEELGSLDELDQARWRRQGRRVRRLPYDYVALFKLTGRRSTIVPAAINISAEAWFICTSIGYSLEEPEPPIPVLNVVPVPGGLSFKYAIIDKGSGRELQNTPIHNLAGLGAPDGTRPFRELVVPYIFAPNSSIVIELHEITTVANGIVHMAFQGYKEFR